jgi:fumarate hydratase class II
VEKCLDGLDADAERAAALVERSLAMATALVPRLGYDLAAEIAQAAWRSGRSVREVCLERRILPAQELAELLDPRRQTGV